MDAAPTIKLFVSTHAENVAVPDVPFVVPVQVGAALADRHFAGMAHDDEGDSISDKNKSYCELTAQWWAWKNVDADYYGFMHYRRYFSFADERWDTNHFGDVFMPTNDEPTMALLGYTEENVRAHVAPYDFVTCEPGSFVEGTTIREQYEVSWQHHIEDLDCVLQIIRERHPEFSEVAERYINGTEGYFCNMFIMRRALFEDYSAWLFDILAEHERRRDLSDYDVQSYRVSGYLAERLCGIYLTWLEEQGYRKGTLQRILFDDVSAPERIEPAFEDGVAVVLSADDFYVPYLSALLQSIKENASAARCYDLIVMTENITPHNQEVLKRQIDSDNMVVRFLNVRRPMRDHKSKLKLNGHFRIETYFRLLLGDLLPSYDKILYLDSDMVVCHDVAELFDTDIDDYLVAACRDPDTAGLYAGVRPGKKEYMDDVLKIKEPYDYFQAGTVLFNLALWRATFSTEDVFAFSQSYDWQLLDQDVLNYLCQGAVKLVDMSWNVLFDWRYARKDQIIARAPRRIYYEYLEARKHPYVVHYAGPDKPWYNPDCDFAGEFWRYARHTPFYEVLTVRMVEELDAPRHRNTKVKETIYQGMFFPAVKKVFAGNLKGEERFWRAYRRVHPERGPLA